MVMARRQTVRDREVCVDEMDVARRPLEEFSEPAQQGADRSLDCIDVVTSTVRNRLDYSLLAVLLVQQEESQRRAEAKRFTDLLCELDAEWPDKGASAEVDQEEARQLIGLF